MPTTIVIGTIRSMCDGSMWIADALRRAKNHAAKIAAMKIRPNGVTQAVLSKWEYMAGRYRVSRTKAYNISSATVSWCSTATRSKTAASSMYIA